MNKKDNQIFKIRIKFNKYGRKFKFIKRPNNTKVELTFNASEELK